MPYKRNPGILIATAIVALHLLIPAAGCVGLVPLNVFFERLRNDPRGTLVLQRRFVPNSRKYVEAGVDRAKVVDALTRIAMNPWFSEGHEAVRALAYIAAELDEEQFQEALLRIVVSDVRTFGSRAVASEFLRLRAAESIRTRVLEYVRSHWCSWEAMEAGIILFFHGDVRYLQFLEEKIEAKKDQREQGSAYNLCRATSVFHVRQMRLAHEPKPDILRAIASSDRTVSREYLVQRAALRGADLKPYAAAVVEFLSLPEELTQQALKIPVIQLCHELGMFTPEQVKRFPLAAPIVIAGLSDTVPWATEFQAKWLKEHRFKKSDVAGD